MYVVPVVVGGIVQYIMSDRWARCVGERREEKKSLGECSGNGDMHPCIYDIYIFFFFFFLFTFCVALHIQTLRISYIVE